MRSYRCIAALKAASVAAEQLDSLLHVNQGKTLILQMVSYQSHIHFSFKEKQSPKSFSFLASHHFENDAAEALNGGR